MKNFFVVFSSFVLAVSLISCCPKSKQTVLGTWEANIVLKSDLAEPSPTGDSIKAFLYTKQDIVLSFAEGGVYTKKVLQEVDRVEFINSSEDVQAVKEYFSKFCNKNLVFNGEYDQKKSIIVFEVRNVQSGDDEPLDYNEFFEKDPSIGDDYYCENYDLKDDALYLNGVKFKKLENKNSAD